MTTAATIPEHVQTLLELNACEEAVEWAATQPSLRQAWRVCPRGDWMLWWVGKQLGPLPPESPERRRLTWVACQCARLAPEQIPEGERAIETSEAWAMGDEGVTLDDVRAASAAASAAASVAASASATDAAFYAVYAASATDAATAATAAVYAAYAAVYAAYAADAATATTTATDAAYAAYAADAAYDAYAADAADATVRRDTLRECATICRREWPTLPTTGEDDGE